MHCIHTYKTTHWSNYIIHADRACTLLYTFHLKTWKLLNSTIRGVHIKITFLNTHSERANLLHFCFEQCIDSMSSKS